MYLYIYIYSQLHSVSEHNRYCMPYKNVVLVVFGVYAILVVFKNAMKLRVYTEYIHVLAASCSFHPHTRASSYMYVLSSSWPHICYNVCIHVAIVPSHNAKANPARAPSHRWHNATQHRTGTGLLKTRKLWDGRFRSLLQTDRHVYVYMCVCVCVCMRVRVWMWIVGTGKVHICSTLYSTLLYSILGGEA
ncbi:hypothetical protein DFP73DRAFT_104102 [Morchella snyderi]|nr:hypothetical protein DFP73DRAFT_104102 [Morchella snyderi]